MSEAAGPQPTSMIPFSSPQFQSHPNRPSPSPSSTLAGYSSRFPFAWYPDQMRMPSYHASCCKIRQRSTFFQTANLQPRPWLYPPMMSSGWERQRFIHPPRASSISLSQASLSPINLSAIRTLLAYDIV